MLRAFSRLAIAVACISATGLPLLLPASASASHNELAIIQDDGRMLTDPAGTLAQFRALGATTVRVTVFWYRVTRDPASSQRPANFDATDPNDYPAAGWAPYDQIVQDAAADGIGVDFTIAGGSPIWADGSGIPPQGRNPYFAWKPNARQFGQFVRAVGERYSGSFVPDGASSALPRVHFWTIWNEPNFGQNLGPQAIDGSTVSVAPAMYRGLVDAAWTSLHATGHGRDTILIGGFAARGLNARPSGKFPEGLPGNYSQTKPLEFIRTLYCVDDRYRQLRGGSARARGCPPTAAGSRRFRAQHPGLFTASGLSDHPYQGGLAPTAGGNLDPNFGLFPDLPRMEREMDRVNRIYGSHTRYAIYNDEYGYITRPPAQAPYVSPAKAAYYLNWSEYLSWRSSRIASYMQYQLGDPTPKDATHVSFADGLITSRGIPKATYYAYRLPLYMPRTAVRRSRGAELWGDVRPAPFMARDSAETQRATIELRPLGNPGFQTLTTIRVSASGYFDIRVRFPRSGYVRLTYAYPATDPFLPVGLAGTTIHSRVIRISVR
jgi:hypothetical protein